MSNDKFKKKMCWIKSCAMKFQEILNNIEQRKLQNVTNLNQVMPLYMFVCS